MGLDRKGWRDLCDEARALAARSDFKRLEAAIAPLLEQGSVLGAAEFKAIHARERNRT